MTYSTLITICTLSLAVWLLHERQRRQRAEAQSHRLRTLHTETARELRMAQRRITDLELAQPNCGRCGYRASHEPDATWWRLPKQKGALNPLHRHPN